MYGHGHGISELRVWATAMLLLLGAVLYPWLLAVWAAAKVRRWQPDQIE